MAESYNLNTTNPDEETITVEQVSHSSKCVINGSTGRSKNQETTGRRHVENFDPVISLTITTVTE